MSKKPAFNVVTYSSRAVAERVQAKAGGDSEVVTFFEFKHSLLHYVVEGKEQIPALTDKMERQGCCRCRGI